MSPADERRTRMNFTIPPKIARAFRAHCERTGESMSDVVAEKIAQHIGYREDVV